MQPQADVRQPRQHRPPPVIVRHFDEDPNRAPAILARLLSCRMAASQVQDASEPKPAGQVQP